MRSRLQELFNKQRVLSQGIPDTKDLVRKKLCETQYVKNRSRSKVRKLPSPLSPKSRSSAKKRNNKLTPVKLDHKFKLQRHKMSASPSPHFLRMSPIEISDDSLDRTPPKKKRLSSGSCSDPIIISSDESDDDEPPAKRSKVNLDQDLPSFAQFLKMESPGSSSQQDPPGSSSQQNASSPRGSLKLPPRKKARLSYSSPSLKPLDSHVVVKQEQALPPPDSSESRVVEPEGSALVPLDVIAGVDFGRESELQVLLWTRSAGHLRKERVVRSLRPLSRIKSALIDSQLTYAGKFLSEELHTLLECLVLGAAEGSFPPGEALSDLLLMLVNKDGVVVNPVVMRNYLTYLQQLLSLHPPGSSEAANTCYRQLLLTLKKKFFTLLEAILHFSHHNVGILKFLVDLYLSDYWAVLTTPSVRAPLFTHLFWEASTDHNRLTPPLKKLLSHLESLLTQHPSLESDGLDHLLCLLFLASTQCSDVSYELRSLAAQLSPIAVQHLLQTLPFSLRSAVSSSNSNSQNQLCVQPRSHF